MVILKWKCPNTALGALLAGCPFLNTVHLKSLKNRGKFYLFYSSHWGLQTTVLKNRTAIRNFRSPCSQRICPPPAYYPIVHHITIPKINYGPHCDPLNYLWPPLSGWMHQQEAGGRAFFCSIWSGVPASNDLTVALLINLILGLFWKRTIRKWKQAFYWSHWQHHWPLYQF